jgi:hypothetical protein
VELPRQSYAPKRAPKADVAETVVGRYMAAIVAAGVRSLDRSANSGMSTTADAATPRPESALLDDAHFFGFTSVM